MASGKIGIIAGQGELPELLSSALEEQNRDFFILAIREDTSPELVKERTHQWIEMAEIARTIDIFREHQVEEILMAGKLSRPPIKALKPPALAARILKRIGAAFFKGDDALFKAIIGIFEEEGFRIIGADEVLKELLTPKGVLTQTIPTPAQEEEITLAAENAKKLGAADIGQAAITFSGEVLAEETIDGTDALIATAIERKGKTQGGILAKMKKPKQERRVDLPAIGPDTIEALAAGKFDGVVLEAEHSLIIQREKVIALADKHGLFVIGL
jgi:DUF1009 family protein